MGNNFTQFSPIGTQNHLNNANNKISVQYITICEQNAAIAGRPKVVKSCTTGIELEEYFVQNFDCPKNIDIEIYRLRSSSYSKSIVVVFHHQLLDEASKRYLVRTEKMKVRLNQIFNFSFIQALVVLQSSLNGFAELVFNAKTPFLITQKMIGINDSFIVRVWANENYSLNRIMPVNFGMNQNLMIHQAYSIVSAKVNIENQAAFNDIILRIGHCRSVMDAKNILSLMLRDTDRRLILQGLVLKHLSCSINSSIGKNPTQSNPHPISMSRDINVLKFQLSPEQYIKNDEINKSKMPRTHLNYSQNQSKTDPIINFPSSIKRNQQNTLQDFGNRYQTVYGSRVLLGDQSRQMLPIDKLSKQYQKQSPPQLNQFYGQKERKNENIQRIDQVFLNKTQRQGQKVQRSESNKSNDKIERKMIKIQTPNKIKAGQRFSEGIRSSIEHQKDSNLKSEVTVSNKWNRKLSDVIRSDIRTLQSSSQRRIQREQNISGSNASMKKSVFSQLGKQKQEFGKSSSFSLNQVEPASLHKSILHDSRKRDHGFSEKQKNGDVGFENKYSFRNIRTNLNKQFEENESGLKISYR